MIKKTQQSNKQKYKDIAEEKEESTNSICGATVSPSIITNRSNGLIIAERTRNAQVKCGLVKLYWGGTARLRIHLCPSSIPMLSRYCDR